MNTGTAQLYKVAVPPELLDELEAAMRDAATEAGQASGYTATRLDPQQAASELQFDPITPMVVLKFVLESAAAALIGKAVEKLVKKIASRPDPAVRIIVMYPDGEVETINTTDVRQTRAAVDRLLGSGG
jgi:phosphoenolpyruvate carboxylase